MNTASAHLKATAASSAAAFPALLAQADQLAQALILGGHGRRRAGRGEEFWQYRPAQSGDAARSIDWRRSAQSDGHFVREQEWQAAQSVYLWADPSSSMRFASHKSLSQKSDRAAALSLALAILLMRGGERVALVGDLDPPRLGAAQLSRLAQSLCAPDEEAGLHVSSCLPNSQAIFLSDFMGDMAPIEAAMEQAAARGMRGVLYHVLDPAEETFPYQGRTIFEAMDGAQKHETLRASDLQTQYLERLATRKYELSQRAKALGWRYGLHRTDASAQSALLWLFQAIQGPR